MRILPRFKKILATSILAVALAQRGHSEVIISSFGLNLQSADLMGSWSTHYNSATSTLTDSDSPGSGISKYGGPAFGDVTGLSFLTLTAAVTTNPGTTFQITLEDLDGNLATANFNWASFGVSSTAITALLQSSSEFQGDEIIGWNLSTGGIGSPLEITFYELVAVPEPQAWVMIAMGMAGVAALSLRRRSIRG